MTLTVMYCGMLLALNMFGYGVIDVHAIYYSWC